MMNRLHRPQKGHDRIRVLKPSRGANEVETLCDEAKVVEIMGVAPAKVVDWLALTGDSTDNIPGARPLPGTPGVLQLSGVIEIFPQIQPGKAIVGVLYRGLASRGERYLPIRRGIELRS